MTMAMTPVAFIALCNDTRTAIHECGGFRKAVAHVFREHNVESPEMREVLTCELHADIRMGRRRCSIPKSPQNLAMYARILGQFGIKYELAVERIQAQYKIKQSSTEGRRLYDQIARALDIDRKQSAFYL
jgi:hypothetical protein